MNKTTLLDIIKEIIDKSLDMANKAYEDYEEAYADPNRFANPDAVLSYKKGVMTGTNALADAIASVWDKYSDGVQEDDKEIPDKTFRVVFAEEEEEEDPIKGLLEEILDKFL